MSYKVGPKGQVVIAKEIRDRLGVPPGWVAAQEVVDDHVELYFLPPEHNRSLAGMLKPYPRRSLSTEADLDRAREEAWVSDEMERYARGTLKLRARQE